MVCDPTGHLPILAIGKIPRPIQNTVSLPSMWPLISQGHFSSIWNIETYLYKKDPYTQFY